MNLFVYGTLMVPQVMHAVCGFTAAAEPAVLQGHRRRRVRGEVYPGIVASQGEQVEGMLYRGLTDRHLSRLDEFEGEMYRRSSVEVEAGNTGVPAFAYLMAPAFVDALSNDFWSLDAFVTHALQGFLEAYPGFDRTAAGHG